MQDINPTLLVLVTAALAMALGRLAYHFTLRRTDAITASGEELRSTPDYYGWYVLVWMFVPVLVLSLAAAALELADVVRVPGRWIAVAWVVLPLALMLPALGLVRARLNARVLVERVIYAILLAAALVSIFTTVGILLSVLFESIRFFGHPAVTVTNFLFGTDWSPGGAFLASAGRGAEQGTGASFGAVPLFAGTFMITGIAMLVAVPVGVLSAIYLSEYSAGAVRKLGKPLIEVLAGIPTVVYGFFAAITVAPLIVRAAAALGLDASYQNALAPGLIMGVMIIPFMSSLCDDVMSAVPQTLRRASYAMGATSRETIMQIVLPAAFPGIVSAFLLAVSVAIGETMIVVMAAGLTANLTANPLETMTTVTVHIVDNLTGDQAYDNPQTLSAFGLGLTLLIMTLLLNVASAIVIRRYRMRYAAD
ncbi:phosphate ABC transporter permease subunit PstC [Thiohalocapsa halophila]|uniref:Phosphate transport system permease protein n=1 Tax=Thiohalocapsa halophila TaxID=69359 RepID=A0ABS1CGS1_9GAMM|nr:phosphate ABC transporter permease subunit PstC [Thiohalocapsa halophila]MBK1631111.1 phosphate ABC transporter permease subunit PstC [Thiohalocapsa halophila]